MNRVDHDLCAGTSTTGVLYEELPLLSPDGRRADGLHWVRIALA
jgi:hypothetical protein